MHDNNQLQSSLYFLFIRVLVTCEPDFFTALLSSACLPALLFGQRVYPQLQHGDVTTKQKSGCLVAMERAMLNCVNSVISFVMKKKSIRNSITRFLSAFFKFYPGF